MNSYFEHGGGDAKTFVDKRVRKNRKSLIFINLSAMSNFYYNNENFLLMNLINNSIVTDSELE